ncbi:GL15184 [Drosophila persimilis]|uniref:GL15184 n=1 Tax=Drosophila persimilis TaxID=7234 RepID=B4H3L7_DROPE|nr:GL15184 [Drosophila persimilis]
MARRPQHWPPIVQVGLEHHHEYVVSPRRDNIRVGMPTGFRNTIEHTPACPAFFCRAQSSGVLQSTRSQPQVDQVASDSDSDSVSVFAGQVAGVDCVTLMEQPHGSFGPETPRERTSAPIETPTRRYLLKN